MENQTALEVINFSFSAYTEWNIKLRGHSSTLPKLSSDREAQKGSQSKEQLVTHTQHNDRHIHNGFAGNRVFDGPINVPSCPLKFSWKSPALSKDEI